jgi:hypothetical protein
MHICFRNNVGLRRGFQRWRVNMNLNSSKGVKLRGSGRYGNKTHDLIEANDTSLHSAILNPSVLVHNNNREAYNSYYRDYIAALHR